MSWWFKMDLWQRVMLGLVTGIVLGLGLHYGLGAESGGEMARSRIGWIGDLFLRLIRMLIVPLVFFTLVSGMIAMGDPKRLGSLGARTLGTYFVTTAIAVTLGLLMGSLFQPGASLSADTFIGADVGPVEAAFAKADAAGGFVERIILGSVPTNPVEALATGNILQIIFFSILSQKLHFITSHRHLQPSSLKLTSYTYL